jgi:hypothetical protein
MERDCSDPWILYINHRLFGTFLPELMTALITSPTSSAISPRVRGREFLIQVKSFTGQEPGLNALRSNLNNITATLVGTQKHDINEL